MLLSVITFILQRSTPILLNGEIHALHFLASMSPLNPIGTFLSHTHPTPPPLPFSLFRFLASDTSSSSLSRTESPLQLFVSSHLPHPKPDTFVWPHAASPYCDQVPEPCTPPHCKLAFYSRWAR